jgi:hypothetical protein
MMMHQKSGTLWVPLFVFSYYCFICFHLEVD